MPKKKRKTARFKVGDRVNITFWDHAEDGSELLFEVSGRIGKITPQAYHIDTWRYANPEVPYDENVKRYSILKKAIVDMWVDAEQED